MDEKGLIEAIEKGIENIKERPFDTYVLGPFMIWYGLKSKGMPKVARTVMVSGGIWRIFYSWRKYREIPQNIVEAPKKFLNLTQVD